MNTHDKETTLSENENSTATTPSAAPSGERFYEADVQMMRLEVDHAKSTVMPHFETLIAQARKVGNGAATITALESAMEAAGNAVGLSDAAIIAVVTANDRTAKAYADSAGEAATDAEYFTE